MRHGTLFFCVPTVVQVTCQVESLRLSVTHVPGLFLNSSLGIVYLQHHWSTQSSYAVPSLPGLLESLPTRLGISIRYATYGLVWFSPRAHLWVSVLPPNQPSWVLPRVLVQPRCQYSHQVNWSGVLHKFGDSIFCSQKSTL